MNSIKNIYRIEISFIPEGMDIHGLSDEEWITESLRQDLPIYTVQQFCEAFNAESTNEPDSYVRYI